MKRLILSSLLLTLTLTLTVSARAADHYLTVDSNDWREAQQQLRASALPAQAIAERRGVSLLKVTDAQLDQLTIFFHEQKKRCGGFFAFDNLARAQSFLTSEGSASTAIAAAYTIDQQTVVRPLLSAVTESNLRSTMTTLANYQNRYYNSSYGKSSSEWIRDQWSQLASGRSDISVALKGCSNCGLQQNVVLTITGTELPNEYVVLGAHADSIISGMTTESRAPGADDDGSGVSVLTEVLRVALANNFRPRRTVQFMAYAGEEVGLRGSQALASEYQTAGKNVYGVIQFDMTNYAGTGADVWVMTDNGNASMIQYLRDLFDEYLAPTGLTRADTSCGYACSDHASWTRSGFPAAMYAETSFSQTNQNLHTVNDTLAASGGNANHSVAFAKLGLVFAYEAGKTGSGPPPPTDPELQPGVPVGNLSGAAGSSKYYLLKVPGNAINLRIATTGGSGDLDLYVKYGSKPTTASADCKSEGSNSTETCNIPTAQLGDYYVLLSGYSAYSGVTLTASYAVVDGGVSFENTADYIIPDNNTTGIKSSITVTGTSTAGTVSVAFNIVHPYIGDLIVDLIHPDGTVYNLHNRSGGSADNINKTYSVNVGSKPRAGVWNLRVRDRAASDVGKIDSWKLTFPSP
ncbi:M20/M25/M40 family metallo-hydrolase [Permianibacter sp. IMCC34836]|uniref:M20/M25/M40 family metallo-hydrolase n=1 Tax=Permianibacter fluminis TaxID=2738515 RepID=UPI001557781F|nr:M20/M25/M40 family metallo-hydrolase [Permianibacter fluminis]NQD35846.1 M20/M25/M40 family metallo-hydrolase [Permianibacter fluminis]